jgi:hypothetical protein
MFSILRGGVRFGPLGKYSVTGPIEIALDDEFTANIEDPGKRLLQSFSGIFDIRCKFILVRVHYFTNMLTAHVQGLWLHKLLTI